MLSAINIFATSFYGSTEQNPLALVPDIIFFRADAGWHYATCYYGGGRLSLTVHRRADPGFACKFELAAALIVRPGGF
jgi:hypothetical protein